MITLWCYWNFRVCREDMLNIFLSSIENISFQTRVTAGLIGNGGFRAPWAMCHLHQNAPWSSETYKSIQLCAEAFCFHVLGLVCPVGRCREEVRVTLQSPAMGACGFMPQLVEAKKQAVAETLNTWLLPFSVFLCPFRVCDRSFVVTLV